MAYSVRLGLVAGFIALVSVALPAAWRPTWGYPVEAVLLVALLLLVIERTWPLLSSLGRGRAVFVGLLVLLGSAQIVKERSLFPLVPWSMYGGRVEDRVVREYVCHATKRSGAVAQFVPSHVMKSLAYSRATNGIRASLNHCFRGPPDDVCEREKERTRSMLSALAQYENTRAPNDDPIVGLSIVQRELSPPFDPSKITEREVLSFDLLGDVR